MTTPRDQDLPIISATDLGRYVFCPQAERLASSGQKQSAAAYRRMQQGNTAHDQWQTREDRARPVTGVAVKLLILITALIALALYLVFQG